MLKTRHLKTVFNETWFKEAEKQIQLRNPQQSLNLKTHTAFIGFLDLWSDDGEMITKLDDAFDELRRFANPKILKTKLRLLAGRHDDYVSNVFEMIVVAIFAKHNMITDYEPPISSGTPEARIQIANQEAIIEARATLDKWHPDGAFNPKEYGRKLAYKIREKYEGQLRGANEPVILFFAGNVGTNQLLEEAMLREVEKDPKSQVLSAIVICDTCVPRESKVWVHPLAQRPLEPQSIDDLMGLLGAKKFSFRML